MPAERPPEHFVLRWASLTACSAFVPCLWVLGFCTSAPYALQHINMLVKHDDHMPPIHQSSFWANLINPLPQLPMLIRHTGHSAWCAGYTPSSGGAATESAGNDVTGLILTSSCSSEFVYTGAGVLLRLAVVHCPHSNNTELA